MKKKITKKENKWKKRKHGGKKSGKSPRLSVSGKKFQPAEKREKKSQAVVTQLKMQEKEAVLLSLSRNFAFARPTDGGEDVFIRAEDLAGAFPGDLVRLSHIEMQEKGPSGRVDTVIQAGSRMLTGVIGEEDGVCGIRCRWRKSIG